MGSALNKQEWNAVAPIYLAGHTGAAAPDPLCCPLLPPDLRGRRILDAACGAGPVARYLAHQGAIVVGVDIAEALIAEATAIEAAHPLGITYRVHDLLEPLPADLGTFDIALSVMAIMDVEDPLAALRHIGRIIRPGGQLVFSLLHPCFYRPKLDAEQTGFDLATYFDRERIEGRYLEAPDGTRVSYRQFHRTLGDYLTTLVVGGFCLTNFVELITRQLAISCQKHQVPLES